MFTSEEGGEATSPSFIAENAPIEASSSSLEGLIATQCMQRDVNSSTLPMANKYLFSNPQLFTNEEGKEATSSSFATENEAIDASNSSLEALIAT